MEHFARDCKLRLRQENRHSHNNSKFQNAKVLKRVTLNTLHYLNCEVVVFRREGRTEGEVKRSLFKNWGWGKKWPVLWLYFDFFNLLISFLKWWGVALMAISNNGTNPPLQLLCGVSTLGVRPGVTKTSTRKGLNILKAGSSCFYLRKVMALRQKI